MGLFDYFSEEAKYEREEKKKLFRQLKLEQQKRHEQELQKKLGYLNEKISQRTKIARLEVEIEQKKRELRMIEKNPTIEILKNAARMLPKKRGGSNGEEKRKSNMSPV
jgi:ClpP class serine protease